MATMGGTGLMRKKKLSIFEKGASTLLAGAFLLTNVIAAHAGENAFWAERRGAAHRMKPGSSLSREGKSQNRVLAQLPHGLSASPIGTEAIPPISSLDPTNPCSTLRPSLPLGDMKKWGWLPELVSPFGDIREIHLSSQPNAPLIIHLQDVHEVEEAQRNLAGLLERLQTIRGISFVGLEGAVGPFDLDYFRSSSSTQTTRSLADTFLKLGYLTGPEVAGIVAAKVPTLWGIEDLPLYHGHIQAFERSEAGRAPVRQFLATLSAAAETARETIYQPALRALDDHRRAYVLHRESLGDYVTALWSALKGDKKAYPQGALLVKLLAQERVLDFKEVERQRMRLADVLAQRLAPADLDRLVKASLSYRSGRQTPGVYQRTLAALCRQNNIRLDAFGPLESYMGYVQGVDRLNSGELLEEFERLEAAALGDTAGTRAEKKLVEVFRGLTFFDKLTNHSLTPPEWAAFKKSSYWLDEIQATLGHLQGRPVEVSAPPPDLSPYKEFCAKAEERNGALVKNVLAKMRTEKVNTAVLVAGGFHTEGMTALLREANVSYVVITPKISKVPDTRPMDIFVRAPLPLDKLLAGDVIHLAYPRLTQISLETIATAKNASERRKIFRQAWTRELNAKRLGRVSIRRNKIKDIFSQVQNQGERLVLAISRWVNNYPGKTRSGFQGQLFVAYCLIGFTTISAMILAPDLALSLVQGPWPLSEKFESILQAMVFAGFGGAIFVPGMTESMDADEFDPNAYLKKHREGMAQGPPESLPKALPDFTVAGYRFPAPFGWEISQSFEKEDVRSHAGESPRPLEEVVSHSAERAMDQDKRRWLVGRFVVLGKLLEANKKVLGSLQARNREQAEEVLALVRKMGSAYESLAKGSSYLEESEDFPEFLRVLGSLTDGFEKKLKELSPGELIGDEVRELIITPTDQATSWSNVQTLHKLINLMHQKGESRFDAAARKVEGNMEFSVNGIDFSVANLDDRPLFYEGKTVSRPLAIMINAARNAQQIPANKPRLIVRGNYLQGSIQLGEHSANFSALVSPLDEGGRFRLNFTEVKNETGNQLRLMFLRDILSELGVKTDLTDQFHLAAYFDKDNGTGKQAQIADIVDMALRVLYYSPNLDGVFSSSVRALVEDNGMAPDEAFKKVSTAIRPLAILFVSEGKVPFFTPSNDTWGATLLWELKNYLGEISKRNKLKSTINQVLGQCGLPKIPPSTPFGQKVIDDYFFKPIKAALARREVVVEEDHFRRSENYSPVEDLARTVLDAPKDALELAVRLGSYDARSLGLRPIGAVGRLTAGVAQWPIGEEGWVILHGLIHPETGRLLYATAQRVIGNGERQPDSVDEMDGYLREAGLSLSDNRGLNSSLSVLAEALLRSPPRLENMPGVVCYGQGASSGPGWPVAGMASFDPQYRSPPGKKLPVFVVPRLEAHQIELMDAAGGFLVPNGLITSHAFVTLREGEVPGVVVSDAQWISGDSTPKMVVPIWRPRAAVMSEEKLWISEGVEEEGRIIEPGTVLLIDGERGAVSILSGEGMSETLGLWESLSSGHETPASVVASVADSNHFDRLEFVLFQAIWDRGVDEKTRQEIVGLLETAVAGMPESYQRRFESLKQIHLDASLERANNYQVAAREKRGWYNTVLEIQDMIEKIREQLLSVNTVARILSLQNPLITNLLFDEQEASVHSERLRTQAQGELEAWAAKTLTPDDLPRIRKILKQAQLNGLNPNDNSYQHLAEMGRRFFEEKLKRIRETKRAVFATEEVDIDWRDDGSKFAHLGESKKIVENNDAFVPKGMGLTPFGFEKYLVENGINRDFDLLVEQLDSLLEENSIEEPQRQAGIKQISESIQNLIKVHSIPKKGPLAEEIFKMIKILGLEKVLLMVRSNGAQEDGEKMAFAGGARSFSEVDLSHLLEKIQETWMSFWTPSAIAYRAHKGVKQADENMGVIVQEFIKADVSGTLFTRNPSTGANDIFVSAGRGSGKDVEASAVPSDEYAVRKSDGEEIGFPTVRNNPRALGQEQIKPLVRVANALENHFNHPLIIEYLFKEGKLWILQVRYDTAIRNNNGKALADSEKPQLSVPKTDSGFKSLFIGFLIFLLSFGILGYDKQANALESFNPSFYVDAPIERDAVNNMAVAMHDVPKGKWQPNSKDNEVRDSLLGGPAGVKLNTFSFTVTIDGLRRQVESERKLLQRKRGALAVSLGLDAKTSPAAMAPVLGLRHTKSSESETIIKDELSLLLASSYAGENYAMGSDAAKRVHETVRAYHAGQGMYNFEQALATALDQGGEIALEVTTEMVSGKKEGLSLTAQAQWDRLRMLARAATEGTLKKPVRLILQEGVEPKEVRETLLLRECGSLVGKNSQTISKSDLAVSAGKYSVDKFLDWLEREQGTPAGSIPVDIHLMDRNEWDFVGSFRKNIRLLVDVLPGIVFDATSRVSNGIQRLLVVDIAA